MQSLDMNATFKILKTMEGSLHHGDFIFNKIPGVASIVSEEGQILRGNSHLADFLNCSKEEVNRFNFQQLINEKEWVMFLKSFKKLDRFPEINFITTIKGKEKNGLTMRFSWTISFLKRFDDREMNTYLIIGSDVTDMVHYQEILEKKVKERTKELEQTMEELKSMQGHMVTNARMASLGEMAGNVAHEINNPLNIINLSLRSIKKNLDKEGVQIEKVNKNLDKTERMVIRMGDIIQSLKGFSRDASKDPMQYYKLEDVIEGSLLVIREKIVDDNIALETNHESLNDIQLFCNKTALNQVIVNILTNAYDYVKPITEGERWIKINASEVGDSVEIAISDSGPGIAEENVDKIWEPFFTTKELGSGTGLGLSMAKGIIEKQHRGKLILIPGSPTTFVITLPKNLEELGEGGSPDDFF